MIDNKDNNITDILGAEEAASRAVEQKREELLLEQKSRKKKLVKIGSIMTLISVVMVFATRSWFTMSREVSGTGANMTSNELVFELKTIGTTVPNSNIIESLGYKNGTPVTSGSTTTNVGDIKWLLQADDDMAGAGLRPGTSGSLNFVIMPVNRDNSKNLSVNYKIELSAYRLSDDMKAQIAAETQKKNLGQPYSMPTVTVNDLIKISTDSDARLVNAVEYLKGHMLLFKNEDNTGRIQFGEVQTISFNSLEDKEIPLHWIWPETLGDMVLTGDNIVNICTGDEKNALTQHIQNNPNLYFYLNDLNNDMLENGKLKTNVLGDDLSDYYPTLNLAYNDADQEIGVNIQYIMIELIVDGDIVSAE